jgi:hypothetical protein
VLVKNGVLLSWMSIYKLLLLFVLLSLPAGKPRQNCSVYVHLLFSTDDR